MNGLQYEAMRILYKEGYTVADMAKIFCETEYIIQTHLDLQSYCEKDRKEKNDKIRKDFKIKDL